MRREVVTVGALLRRGFRRMLDQEGVSYSEDRGFLDSQFIVKGEPEAMARVEKRIKDTLGK
jgi:hypothetical protein